MHYTWLVPFCEKLQLTSFQYTSSLLVLISDILLRYMPACLNWKLCHLGPKKGKSEYIKNPKYKFHII